MLDFLFWFFTGKLRPPKPTPRQCQNCAFAYKSLGHYFCGNDQNHLPFVERKDFCFRYKAYIDPTERQVIDGFLARCLDK